MPRRRLFPFFLNHLPALPRRCPQPSPRSLPTPTPSASTRPPAWAGISAPAGEAGGRKRRPEGGGGGGDGNQDGDRDGQTGVPLDRRLPHAPLAPAKHNRPPTPKANGESWPRPPPPPYKKEVDFCLEFVKSGAPSPVNGAPRGAG